MTSIGRDGKQLVEARTLPADTAAYVDRMREYAEHEENECYRGIIEDNIAQIGEGVANDAIRHRFFLILQYEAQMKSKGHSVSAIIQRLNEEADTARRYLICASWRCWNPASRTTSF